MNGRDLEAGNYFKSWQTYHLFHGKDCYEFMCQAGFVLITGEHASVSSHPCLALKVYKEAAIVRDLDEKYTVVSFSLSL